MATSVSGGSASSDKVSFVVGECFDSFAALESKINVFEKDNFVQLWKRDPRSVEAASKRLTRHLKPELKYYELKMCCIHGGQAFRSQGKGIRNVM